MTWRRFTALIGLAAVTTAPASTAADGRPNFVVIMADDLGYGDLSCYGNEAYETPNLDALARSGVRLTDFHSNGVVCSPTRAALLTGRYQQRAGIPGVVYADPARPEHAYGLKAHELTFAEALAESGYATALIGKWHLGYTEAYNPTRHGFGAFLGFVSGNVDYISHLDNQGRHDWWVDEEKRRVPGYTTSLINDQALDFMKQSGDAPFCLYVAHAAPHAPYQGPGDPAIRRREGRPDGSGGSRPQIDRARAYREMVQEMDRGVGQLIASLEELGLRRDTLVLFFSDNGANSNGSNGPLRGFKGTNWEGGHRVAGIASWPGRIRPGAVSDVTAMTMDIMPTLLDLAGVDSPKEKPLDGVSLVNALTRSEALPVRDLFWERNGQAAMRRGDWKLMVSTRRDRAEPAAPFLANLATDLSEKRNVADRYPDRVAQMLVAIEDWRSEVSRGATSQP